jgi:hypothetical protein
MKYKHCPRCDSNFSINNSDRYVYVICSNIDCGVNYFHQDGGQQVFSVHNIITDGDYINWDLVNNRCNYWYRSSIDLPWLNPKITAQQLKKIITFI